MRLLGVECKMLAPYGQIDQTPNLEGPGRLSQMAHSSFASQISRS